MAKKKELTKQQAGGIVLLEGLIEKIKKGHPFSVSYENKLIQRSLCGQIEYEIVGHKYTIDI